MGRYVKKHLKKYTASEFFQKDLIESLFEWIDVVVPIVTIFIFIMVFLFRINDQVEGSSMMNTLHDGDRIFVNYMFTPKQGDVIVIKRGKSLEQRLVKRIIATEGQTLDINYSTGSVIVDGKVMDEPYILGSTTIDEGGKIPQIVPEGYVFVMGDNRAKSLDSRSNEIGLISAYDIIGKVEGVLWNGKNGPKALFERSGLIS